MRPETNGIDRRNLLRSAGCSTLAGFWLPQLLASAQETPRAPAVTGSPVGKKQIVQGLDGMSRVADRGNNAFAGGHNAAAVLASAYFCKDEELKPETQRAILAHMKARLLTSRIYVPRSDEVADRGLIAGLVQELDSGIDTLRRAGHNIIFAVLSLRGLKEVPDAATPARINGLRKTVRSFGTTGRGRKSEPVRVLPCDLSDEQKLIAFILDEYLSALALYLNGKGHHGSAAHLLTVGHALIELNEMGYRDTAAKGLAAYDQFVQQVRRGVNLGGPKKIVVPPQYPVPLDQEYWLEQTRKRSSEIVSAHLIKYPYSFYALTGRLKDDRRKREAFDKLFYLTAIS